MNLSNLRIIADERERKSGIPELLKSVGINLEIKTLLVGDYIVQPEIVVERKSISDLVSSIFDGRLFDQCKRLKKHYSQPIVLIEGNFNKIEKISENPFVFYGAVSSVLLDFKIPVVYTPNIFHTSKLLISMSSRKGTVEGYFLKKIKKSNDIKKQQLLVLCSLPGIGEKTAIKLLDKFGSPIDVLTASLVNLLKIKGLSKLRIKKIKKMLETKHKNTDELTQKTLNC